MANVTFEAFEEEWLNDILSDNPSTLEKGRRFSRKLIGQWLEFDDEYIAPDDIIYCDGTGDGGIDIAYLQRGETEEENSNEGDTWYLVQSKYGKAFQGVNTLLQEAVKLFDTLDGRRTNISSLTENLLKRLRTFKESASEKDRLVLVFATQRGLTEDEELFVRGIRAMGKERFGAIFEIESITVENIYHRTLEHVSILSKTKVGINADLVESGKELLVGSVGLVQLFNFLKAYKSKTGDLDMLYEKNVRKFLGNRRKVNKGIEKTLIEKPERFGLYNNGITIVVEEFEKLPNNIEYTLTEPYVVNGCQTTRTIWGVLFNKLEAGGTGSNPELEDWKERLSQGIVVIKIVKVGSKGDELLRETTHFTNSQNAVTDKDFIALEDDFQNWSKGMASQYDLFLEIQRGGWDSQKAYDRQNPGSKKYIDHINAFDLLKVYGAAWLGEAGTSFGKNPPFSPGGSIFNRIVNQDDFGLEDLYAAYLLHKSSIKFKFGRGADKPQRRQTRYLFYMLTVELLKDCFVAAEQEVTNKKITRVILKLTNPESHNLFDVLLDFAILIIDDYLITGSEYSVFKEPKFIDKGSDINSFLKWEQLGKGSDSTPFLHGLLTQYRIAMRGGLGGQPRYRDMIKDVILSVDN